MDTDAEILDVKIKKTSKTLGIVLQSDELEKVVFISYIVNNSVSVLKEGDQILQINNQNIDSVQDIGSEIEFKIKGQKYSRNNIRAQEAICDAYDKKTGLSAVWGDLKETLFIQSY